MISHLHVMQENFQGSNFEADGYSEPSNSSLAMGRQKLKPKLTTCNIL